MSSNSIGLKVRTECGIDMDWRKKLNNKMTYNQDITDILQEKVNVISNNYWENDDCKPVFVVSITNEDMSNQKILITVNHLGSRFSYVLFPRDNTYYGYETLEQMMVNMYNQTM
jgi:hypothetical protein